MFKRTEKNKQIMKHSKAPWIYRQDEVIGSYLSNKHICTLTGNFCTEEEKEANGKLIAAAPSMLNLLHALAMEVLQSESYRESRIKMCVDDALEMVRQLN